MNLPKKFAILRKMIQREGLDKVTPNQVLGDVMTDAQYDVQTKCFARVAPLCSLLVVVVVTFSV
jgi:hypothetical protein